MSDTTWSAATSRSTPLPSFGIDTTVDHLLFPLPPIETVVGPSRTL